jgi:hypothetical protein
MTAQTQIYYYTQRQSVVLSSAAAAIATRGYQTVYTKELIVTRGTDNLLEFVFINQDQKPVNLSNTTVIATVMDSTGSTILLEKQLTAVLPVTGIMSLGITSSETDSLPVERCVYSIQVVNNSLGKTSAYVDARGGSRGILNVVNSALPDFKPSTALSTGTHAWPPGSGLANSVTYTSGIFDTQGRENFSVQITYTNFTGNTKIEGSTVSDFSVPYNITSPVEYAVTDSTTSNSIGYTGTVGINVDGYHPFIRLSITNVGTPGASPWANIANTSSYLGGDVTGILVR